ncbi:hypothetical protein Poli38472_012157 [Pythium oligandrum]|uniref:Uncharacterized protein n=1 Tax=Pythium oligandrum TaxID=41045 RepID=A0A8K1CNS7_PYTOL|nr:hypothetical protein Poli38472_012157 [Pythium oligandrum]|eukprot:TMW67041.1 hypothetical protein Poli38472_012157 [Pythium oligandrum]
MKLFVPTAFAAVIASVIATSSAHTAVNNDVSSGGDFINNNYGTGSEPMSARRASMIRDEHLETISLQSEIAETTATDNEPVDEPKDKGEGDDGKDGTEGGVDTPPSGEDVDEPKDRGESVEGGVDTPPSGEDVDEPKDRGESVEGGVDTPPSGEDVDEPKDKGAGADVEESARIDSSGRRRLRLGVHGAENYFHVACILFSRFVRSHRLS